MLSISSLNNSKLSAPVRTIAARIDFFNEDRDITCNHTDTIKDFTIDRVGNSNKFFGYGVAQKINIKLINNELNNTIAAGDYCYPMLGCINKGNFVFTPVFKITEIHRDEKSNELSITAYDMLYFMNEHRVEELELIAPYTLEDVVAAIVGVFQENTMDYDLRDYYEDFSIEYAAGANLDGSETFREVLDAIAEATQTIYYLDVNEALVFKRLEQDADYDFSIAKPRQIELTTRDNKRLAAICHATELGDNVEARLEVSGSTQYIRDNPFLELREDTPALIDAALSRQGGLTIAQFDCSWRGHYALEPGDKLALECKDNTLVYSYLINDTFSYNGGMSQRTSWLYEENEGETAANPTSLGEVLKQTYARVDKANSEITLVASTSQQLNEDINTIKNATNDSIEDLNNSVAELTNKVETKITPEEVSIKIKEELDNGVSRVETATGFTFDEEGLTVSKSNSEMTTQITEDGMTVFRDNTEVLVANHEGVKAKDLHAETYLIIGNNSRFEDYGYSRTGCFWIGG